MLTVMGKDTSYMKLAYEQLKRISDSVGERTGWDFSRVRAERAPVPWNYPDVESRFGCDGWELP